MSGGLMCSMRLLLLWLALLCFQHPRSVHAGIEDEFVSLPLEFGLAAPARLVFNQRDLSACLRDSTAQECVLKGPIKIDQDSWRSQFADTDGAAVIRQQDGPITIRSGGTNFRQPLDWNGLAGVLAMRPGAKLRLINLHLDNFANKSAYVYSSSTPFMSIGVGLGVWPTFNMAPNTTVVGLNLSATFTIPSDSESCARYVMQSRNYLIQSYGAENIVAHGPTSTLIIGPNRVAVPIRNGSTGAPLGSARSVYKYLTLQCLEQPVQAAAGAVGQGKLAAAITVPVGVAALLATGLLLWRRQRHARRAKQSSLPGSSEPPGKHPSQALLLSDVDVERPATRDPMGRSGSGSSLGQHQAIKDQKVMLRQESPFPSRAGWPTGDSADTPASLSAVTLQQHNTSTRDRSSTRVIVPSAVAYSSSQAQPAQAGYPHRPPQDASISGSTAAAAAAAAHGHGPSQMPYSVHQQIPVPHQQLGPSPSLSTRSGGYTQLGSTLTHSTLQPPTPQGSLRPHSGMDTCPSCDTCSQASGFGRAKGHRCGHPDTTTAVLKARSDAAVLKDLKLGPLLGPGCFGRVSRGRWKATPVAVKIIEHYSSREGVGSSKGNRISAGREMLFATSISHPNLVTTYHISTLSTTQRAAAASSLLFDTRPSPSNTSASGADSRRSSGSSTGTDQSQPDLLETYIVMEFCPRGSLERALKQGRFRRHDGQPDMTTIYKALLDTASGLDYLHSIGVVHGDLKTANVLLKGSARDSKGMACKITDFGLSRVLDVNASHVSTGTHGTIVYMPKELLLSGRMTQATDIYSFGLMMWELITSRHIMECEEGVCVGQMFYMIAYQDWRPQVPEGCPPGYADLIVSCWQEDLEQRPTAQQLLRRLQLLQGHARQESVAACRATAAASRAYAAEGGSSEVSTAAPSRAASTAQLQDSYSTGGADAGVQINDPADGLAADAVPASTHSRSGLKAAPCSPFKLTPGSSPPHTELDSQSMQHNAHLVPQYAAATCSSLDSEGPFALMLGTRGSSHDSGTAADLEQDQGQQDQQYVWASGAVPAAAAVAAAGTALPAEGSSVSGLVQHHHTGHATVTADACVSSQHPAGGPLLYSTAPGPVYLSTAPFAGTTLDSPALSQMTLPVAHSSLRLRTTSSEHTQDNNDGAALIAQPGGYQTADPYLDGVLRRLHSSSEAADSHQQAMQFVAALRAHQQQLQAQQQLSFLLPGSTSPQPEAAISPGLILPTAMQYPQAQQPEQQQPASGYLMRPGYLALGPGPCEVLQPCQPHIEVTSSSRGTSRWYVAPYVCGQEFAGCLPQLEGLDNGSGSGALASMQPYLAALEAIDAARAAAPAATASNGM